MVKVNGQAVLRMPHTPTIDIDQYTCSNTSCFRCLLTRAAFSLTPKSRSSNSVPRHEKIAVAHFNIGYIYLTNPRQTVDFCVLVGEVAIHGADMQLIAILTWFTGRLLIGLTRDVCIPQPGSPMLNTQPHPPEITRNHHSTST